MSDSFGLDVYFGGINASLFLGNISLCQNIQEDTLNKPVGIAYDSIQENSCFMQVAVLLIKPKISFME